MNGYASSIVALLVNKLKCTIATRSAVAVIADLDVISQAPLEMNRAGLGDIVSRGVSIADWKLAELVKGEYFCRVPFEIIADLEDVYAPNISRLSQGDTEVLRALMETLIYSGISMVIANTSAPASGGEHLISQQLPRNSYLGGLTYELSGGGYLRPSIPKPFTILLIGTGLLGFVGFTRKSRSKALIL